MHKVAAALLMTLTLGAGYAVPTQAQGFGIFFGDERSDFFDERSDFFHERIICLTQYQIREAIADLGYTNIYLNVPHDKHIEVRATQGDWVYLLDFNYCTARVEERRRLRPAG